MDFPLISRSGLSVVANPLALDVCSPFDKVPIDSQIVTAISDDIPYPVHRFNPNRTLSPVQFPLNSICCRLTQNQYRRDSKIEQRLQHLLVNGNGSRLDKFTVTL